VVSKIGQIIKYGKGGLQKVLGKKEHYFVTALKMGLAEGK